MSIQNNSGVTVGDVMLGLDICPVASERVIVKEVLESMDEHRLGVVCITDDEGKLSGILTEGDMRRVLLRVQKPLAALMADDVGMHAMASPKTTQPDTLLADAVTMMGNLRVWDLPVVDAENKLVGLLHLHQAISGVLAK